MIGFYIYEEEWYPVLTLVNRQVWNTNKPAQFTDKELADIRRVEKEFNDWQDRIAERFNYKSGADFFGLIEDVESPVEEQS